jgi:hypothetical protein
MHRQEHNCPTSPKSKVRSSTLYSPLSFWLTPRRLEKGKVAHSCTPRYGWTQPRCTLILPTMQGDVLCTGTLQVHVCRIIQHHHPHASNLLLLSPHHKTPPLPTCHLTHHLLPLFTFTTTTTMLSARPACDRYHPSRRKSDGMVSWRVCVLHPSTCS